MPESHKYHASLEIAGRAAMWTRPDSGDTPTSYPAPTRSAVKGIFESILWLQTAEVVPARVEICAPLVYHSYTTNYGGPLRKSDQLKDGTSFQLIAVVLINVRYRLHAVIRGAEIAPDRLSEKARAWAGVNGAHAYCDMLEKRLKRGQFHRTPCLGWQEFTPEYLGPLRPETQVQGDLNLELPSMLQEVFPRRSSSPRPVFAQNVKIEKGVLTYAS